MLDDARAVAVGAYGVRLAEVEHPLRVVSAFGTSLDLRPFDANFDTCGGCHCAYLSWFSCEMRSRSSFWLWCEKTGCLPLGRLENYILNVSKVKACAGVVEIRQMELCAVWDVIRTELMTF